MLAPLLQPPSLQWFQAWTGSAGQVKSNKSRRDICKTDDPCSRTCLARRSVGADDLLAFFFRTGVQQDILALLGAGADQDVHGGIAAIVEDHVSGQIGIGFARPVENAANIVPVIGQRFALDREHGNTAVGDSGCGVVLRREDVAGGPAHFCAQSDKRFNQHCGLDRHVQRAGDACTLERLCSAILLAQSHQAGHFGFGNRDLVAAILRQRDILDDVFLSGSGGCHDQNSCIRVAVRAKGARKCSMRRP